jgi:hypothetical protein
MAKKLVKVEVKGDKLQPNAILLEDGEILTATCDIYKFNLSRKNKLGQLAARNLGSDEGYDTTDFDFCLLRVKDSLIEKLEKKEITLFYKNDCWGSDDAEEITSFDSLLSQINDYITDNDGEFLFERVNRKDQVYFIPYLGSLI